MEVDKQILLLSVEDNKAIPKEEQEGDEIQLLQREINTQKVLHALNVINLGTLLMHVPIHQLQSHIQEVVTLAQDKTQICRI